MSTRGIALIEVVISVGLLIIVGAALVQLGVTAMDNSDVSRMRGIALQLADETLEITRSIRDASPSTFFGLSGNKAINASLDELVDTNCNPLVTPFVPPAILSCEVAVSVSGSDVAFYRVVRISDSVGLTNAKDVTAYVFWDNNGTYSNVITSTMLTRWRE